MERIVSTLILCGTLLLGLGVWSGQGGDSRASAPVPPAVRPSPTGIFRTLLSAPPAERERFLSQRPASTRRVIEAKLLEFEILPPEIRERRLQIAELQHFLLQVVGAPHERRAEMLAQTPDPIRPFVEDRLLAWERLPPAQQQELLAQQRILASAPNRPGADPAPTPSSRVPPDLESALEQWQKLTAEERTRKLADFQRFFDLSERDQARILGSIPTTERRQMEATVSQYSSLTPEQRARVIRGIRRFVTLTTPERAQFVQSVSQWQLMPPAERSAWRDLVQAVQPPPLPQATRPRTFLVGTNSP